MIWHNQKSWRRGFQGPTEKLTLQVPVFVTFHCLAYLAHSVAGKGVALYDGPPSVGMLSMAPIS